MVPIGLFIAKSSSSFHSRPAQSLLEGPDLSKAPWRSAELPSCYLSLLTSRKPGKPSQEYQNGTLVSKVALRQSRAFPLLRLGIKPELGCH